MKTILHALEQHASNQPEKTAITGNSQLNWQQLHAATAAMTPALGGCRTIGLHMGNSPAWIVADLAAMTAGVTAVPLPTFFSATQLRHAIQDAQIDTIITDNPQQIAALAEIGGEMGIDIAGKSLTTLFLFVNNGALRNGNTAKLTYTSGTTGTPRGVRLGLRVMSKWRIPLPGPPTRVQMTVRWWCSRFRYCWRTSVRSMCPSSPARKSSCRTPWNSVSVVQAESMQRSLPRH